MKKILIALCVVLLAAGVSAQTPKPFNLYLGVGATIPTGDLGDAYGMGLHGKGGLGFKVAPMFEVIPTLEFHAFSSDVEGADGGNLRIIMFGADGRFTFGAPMVPTKPFLQGGLGFANSSVSDITIGDVTFEVEGSTDFYFALGGGVDFSMGEVLNLFVLARYLSISGDGGSANSIPITVGLRF